MEATEREIEAFRARVARVRSELDAAAQGRPYTLLAATKTQSAEVINLLPEVGINDYGENRVQEWMEKRVKIDQSLRFHQIGRLQSNKIKYIIGRRRAGESRAAVRGLPRARRRARAGADVHGSQHAGRGRGAQDLCAGAVPLCGIGRAG